MIDSCRNCESGDLWICLSLGNQPLPRFPKLPTESVPHAILSLVKCENCGLVQLADTVDRDLVFREFWYQSGISRTIRDDLATIAKQGLEIIKPGDVVVDIGCNDGTLLAMFRDETYERIGFEPAGNMAKLAQGKGLILQDYFSAKEFHQNASKQAKLICAIAMFYDLDDPTGFCGEVASCLDKDGVFIVQQNYLGLMLQNTAYDNICHEHLTYFSLKTLQEVLSHAGLEVFRVELNQVNGGSFKTFIDFKGTRPVEDSVKTLGFAEIGQDLKGRKVYRDFAYRVRTRAKLLSDALSDGRTMIYGAGTRGATIFEFSTHYQKHQVEAAVDNNPDKHGRYYLDTGIPIISREQALKNPPDYFLVLPYHIANEIIEKEKPAFPNTKWIVPLPEFRIV